MRTSGGASPETKSPDLARENINRLKALFPEAVTAKGRVDVDLLRQLVGGTVDREERYGLIWPGKRGAGGLALAPSTGTLCPCRDEGVDWDTTRNLVVEGENLEVLKLLQREYEAKAQLIYIDPPYNTGKNFVYPDRFKDNKGHLELTGQADGSGSRRSSNTYASGRRHAGWLNMMYPRLVLAWNLLKPQGILAVSIDDREMANLRLVCDEVFGERNFLANIVWQRKSTRANDAKSISVSHEYVLVYARDASVCTVGRLPRGEEQLSAYKNPDKHTKGPWKPTPLYARSGMDTRPYTFANGVTWAPPPGTSRRYSDETMGHLDRGDAIWFGADGKHLPARKTFLGEVADGMVPLTLWDWVFAGQNRTAVDELKNLGLGATFTSPKPTRLIRRLLQLFTGRDNQDTVLDFFAGSGSTGHAVMAQNAADGGNRRYILVQIPEPLDPENKQQKAAADCCDQLGKPRNIAEITKERLRRAGTEIGKEHSVPAGDCGFRVFRLQQG